jgi:hypothetical protein
MVGPAQPVTFLAHLPASQLDTAGELLAGLTNCRLAAAVAGPHNLLATMWLTGSAGVAQFEKTLTRQLPDLVVDDRLVHLATIKRVGHVLDSNYPTTGVVQLAAW